jgi:hypothetical protein
MKKDLIEAIRDFNSKSDKRILVEFSIVHATIDVNSPIYVHIRDSFDGFLITTNNHQLVRTFQPIRNYEIKEFPNISLKIIVFNFDDEQTIKLITGNFEDLS